jgi:hypothetical protein
MHFFHTLGEYVHIYIPKSYINIHSMSYFGHTWTHNALYFLGTHVLYAHLTHAISWNLLNVSTQSHMHTWHSGPLGNPCTTYTPEYTSSHSLPYKPAEYHYTYVPRPIPGNIGDVKILILASAWIVCNIVYVQVRCRIHRELCCKNRFLFKLILF